MASDRLAELIAKWEALRADTGFLRPCLICDEPMLPSLSGRGYCLACRVPPDDIPLVPAATKVQEFLRIQRIFWRRERQEWAWQRELREWIKEDSEENSALGSKRTVETSKGGRPPVLDVKRLAKMVKDQPWLFTLDVLAGRFVHPKGKRKGEPLSRRRIQRVLKGLGLLHLLKKPARPQRPAR